MTSPRHSSRRTYNRVSISQDSSDATDESALDEHLAPTPHVSSTEGSLGDGRGSPGVSSVDPAVSQAAGDSSPLSSSVPARIRDAITVTLLDGAQTKFTIRCDPSWTVLQFKSASETVTRVLPQSQRLIHMGKLLQDDKTLGESGIDANDKIIHLFPKPNVVVTPLASEEGGGNGLNQNDAAEQGGGAHVPQIVLDADEAARRSQILILSSQEIFEAQHRVKLFSFLLLVISSMELLTLLTLFVGMEAGDRSDYGGDVPPGNPTDIPPSSNNQVPIRTWQNSDYVDAAISAFGFYSALLGIKATTENTLRLAKQYLGCLLLAAFASNCYYFFVKLQEEEETAKDRDETLDDTSKYTEAFLVNLLPLAVWMLCIIRAWQFQILIREAENEAEERTRGLTTNDEDENVVESARSLPYGSGVSAAGHPSDVPNDLELQLERGISA